MRPWKLARKHPQARRNRQQTGSRQGEHDEPAAEQRESSDCPCGPHVLSTFCFARNVPLVHRRGYIESRPFLCKSSRWARPLDDSALRSPDRRLVGAGFPPARSRPPRPPIPLPLVIVPVLWAAIGGSAAFTLGMYQDLALPVAGGCACVSDMVAADVDGCLIADRAGSLHNPRMSSGCLP